MIGFWINWWEVRIVGGDGFWCINIRKWVCCVISDICVLFIVVSYNVNIGIVV